MRFEATKSDLIAEARAALAAADRDLRSTSRPYVTQRRNAPAPEPPVDEQCNEERQRVIDSIAEEMAALDEAALEHARDAMEAAISRFVTASSVYNRILAEMRQQLRAVGGLSEDDINYRSDSGRPGLRVKDVVRLQALPWQTVSQTALAALRTHAPAERMSLDSPRDSGLEDLAPAPAALPEAALPAAEAEGIETIEPAIDREQFEALFDEMIAPVLAFVRDQQLEITQLCSHVDQQANDITFLREQVERQSAAAEQVTAYLDALRQAQSRLR